MSAGLIKHLRKKTDEDSNTRILMSQWEFDEQLVGKSLENVGSYYPHFSSHNESHSQQILVNIERLLGSNIEKLTATDTWLILEAAYWHDIGMLFNADEVQDVIEDDSFKYYVEELASNNVQDLHEFAKVWHNDGWEAALVHYDNPYKGVEKYRQMVAEWYRKGHAKNSNDVVLKPFEKLNISSPRTELLPKRIYRYLGQICWSHGRNFEEVMSLLPFRQTGMGTEDCHPRFVACLLRLGDLFDIDDNRFCPVMARQVGNMPSLSKTHEHKHQAIREFQLDNETVSVTAICSTEMAYIECRNWFDWIKEEIQNQMSQWKNIVPSREFGLLPTINKLDVEMIDKKVLLNDKPMKFSLDERSAIELLQGNNLYKDDMSIYRELIQNAIDATMIRVWLEHKEDKEFERTNPYDKNTRKLFSQYPITLDCIKTADNEKNTVWKISIEDCGMGISKKDLEYMQKISGSKSNIEKQKVIRQMPEWMRPSGEFGIGLHSAFLLMKNLPSEEQKITIFTKSRLTHESLRIELNSPLSGKSGYCFIEEIKDLGKYGSKVIISTSIKKVILDDEFDNAKVSKFISEKSIYQYSSGNVEIAHTLKSIANKISTSLFKINFTGGSLDVIESLNIRKRKTRAFYWDSEQETALNISVVDHKDIAKVEADQMSSIGVNIYYRGQFVESLHEYELEGILRKYSSYRFIGINVDIYKNSASRFLSLNRNTLQNKNDVLKIITSSLNNMINQSQKQKSIIHNMVKNPSKYSLISNILSIENSHSNNESLDWLKFKVSKDHSLSEILDLNAFTVNSETLEKSSIDKVSLIDGYLVGGIIKTKFIKEKLKQNGFIPYLRIDEGRHYWSNVENIIFSKTNLELKSFEICDFYSNNSGLPIVNLKRFYQTSLNRIGDGFAPKNLFIDFSRIDSSIFPDSDSSRYSKIIINKGEKQFILIPFIEHKKIVIMIDNERLYDSLKSYLEIDFNEFVELYDSLKKYIVNQSKTLNPEWYKAFVKGKQFKPTNLKPLEQLYKSS
jgi:hypothetical protein